MQPLLGGAAELIYAEIWLRRKDSQKRLLAWWCRALKDANGRVTGALATARDITDQKALENELHSAQKMESIGRLAGGVAHDFNNMLGVILGYAEMAMDKLDPADPVRADLVEIRGAAEQSVALTRQLLGFARKQTIAPKVIDLNETIAGMFNMLQRLIGKNIELVWAPVKTLWPVEMDPSQVNQILANLCVNAQDAIKGAGRITVATGNTTFGQADCAQYPGSFPGEYVMLSVADTGSGIDPRTLDHIFEPFFTTKEQGKGTGLGLATIYGIVKQNNGFINVYTALGHGTSFKIYLPRHAA